MWKKVDITMRGFSKIYYMVRQGLKNIKRNGMFSLASMGTIMACIFLLGIFYFILSNVQYIIKDMESSIGLTVLFDEGLEEEQITKIGDQITKRGEVVKCRYISAEEAWENAKNGMFQGKEELVATYEGDNPLADSASYEVYAKDIAAQEGLADYIKKIEGVRQVNSLDGVISGMLSFQSLFGYISSALIIILLAVSFFLISTTVTMGISVRKEEIFIMRLVGATNLFIRAPFIVEGMVIGLIGAVLPLAGLYFIYSHVISFLIEKAGFLSGKLRFLEASVIFTSLIPIALLVGAGIGFFGSFITVRRHLKV